MENGSGGVTAYSGGIGPQIVQYAYTNGGVYTTVMGKEKPQLDGCIARDLS